MVRWQLTDVTNSLDIIETLLTRTQGMAEGAWGAINTITDHETADRARQLIGELRVELRATWERYGLTPPD